MLKIEDINTTVLKYGEPGIYYECFIKAEPANYRLYTNKTKEMVINW